MATPVRQQSFAKGEFSKSLWARTEFDGYQAGARRLRNMVVTPWGAAANRPGTGYVAETLASGKGRMIPFTFSETDSLLLVFTDLRIRFYALDAVTGLPGVVESAPGVPYAVVTPYTAAELAKIRYAQVGDVITLCHPSHPPQELTRTSAAPLAFTLTSISFDVPAFPAAVTPYALYPMAGESLPTYPAKQWLIELTAICEDAKGNVFETKPLKATKQRALPWDPARGYNQYSYVSYGGHNYYAPDGHWPRIGVAPDVDIWEGDGSPMWDDHGVFPDVPDRFPVYPNMQVGIWAENLIAADPGFRIKAFRAYRGRNPLLGYVGELSDDTLFFWDQGDTPDWARTPPKGENPFKIYDWAGALLRTEAPAVVTYHEQRRVFARTNERPGFLFFSATNAYSNFDQHDPAIAEDALITEVASWRWEEIRALISGRVLLALSSSTEWVADGGQDGAAITPLGWATRPRTERGSSWVEPLKVGDDEILFIPPAANLVRELSWDGNSGKYSAADMTLLSRHLFKRRQIVAWDWQEEPWSIIWCALDDGQLLSLCYFGGQVAAWTWHDTDGIVEDICTLREGDEDAVYLIVARTIGGVTRRYIERMHTRQVDDRVEGVFLDSSLTYRGAPATHINGLDHLEGKTVVALADGAVARTGPAAADLVVTGGAIDLDPGAFPDGASVVHVGLPYVSELETLDLGPGAGKTRVKSIGEVAVEFEDTAGGWVGQKLPTDPAKPTKGLEELRMREVSDGFGPPGLKSGVWKIPTPAEWNVGGRVVVKQIDPLPMTILAVTRMVDYGG